LINSAISGEYDSAHKSEKSAHTARLYGPQRVPLKDRAGVVFFWAKRKAPVRRRATWAARYRPFGGPMVGVWDWAAKV
jgi:hypothetical protein